MLYTQIKFRLFHKPEKKNAMQFMKPGLSLSKADNTQVGKTNITCSFSSEASRSISSDVSAYPAITAETRKVKRDPCCAEGMGVEEQ